MPPKAMGKALEARKQWVNLRTGQSLDILNIGYLRDRKGGIRARTPTPNTNTHTHTH